MFFGIGNIADIWDDVTSGASGSVGGATGGASGSYDPFANAVGGAGGYSDFFSQIGSGAGAQGTQGGYSSQGNTNYESVFGNAAGDYDPTQQTQGLPLLLDKNKLITYGALGLGAVLLVAAIAKK